MKRRLSIDEYDTPTRKRLCVMPPAYAERVVVVPVEIWEKIAAACDKDDEGLQVVLALSRTCVSGHHAIGAFEQMVARAVVVGSQSAAHKMTRAVRFTDLMHGRVPRDFGKIAARHLCTMMGASAREISTIRGIRYLAHPGSLVVGTEPDLVLPYSMHVAGSSVLHLVMSELSHDTLAWEPKDVDIWSVAEDGLAARNDLLAMWRCMTWHQPSKTIVRGPALEVRGPGTVMQFLSIHGDGPQSVFDAFDLSCCQFSLSTVDSVSALYTTPLALAGVLRGETVMLRHGPRVQKILDYPDDELWRDATRTVRRACKYVSRGFAVRTGPRDEVLKPEVIAALRTHSARLKYQGDYESTVLDDPLIDLIALYTRFTGRDYELVSIKELVPLAKDDADGGIQAKEEKEEDEEKKKEEK